MVAVYLGHIIVATEIFNTRMSQFTVSCSTGTLESLHYRLVKPYSFSVHLEDLKKIDSWHNGHGPTTGLSVGVAGFSTLSDNTKGGKQLSVRYEKKTVEARIV